MIRSLPVILVITLYLSACAQLGNFGSSLKYNIQGEYYLYNQDYKQGLETFSQAVKKDKQNPEAQYYFGRFLLAENEFSKALPFLKQATVLDPGESDYYFWLGVAYGESRQERLERKSYKKALGIDPNNIQALTYLANNYLRAKKYKEALKYYDMALDLSSADPQALYNRTIALRKLGRVGEEKKALRDYLNLYSSGSFARLAADRLNYLGDYSYRNYSLGFRTITLGTIGFIPSSDRLSDIAYPSLDLLGETVEKMPRGTLDIIVYCQNKTNLAKKRAITIREYLTRTFPDLGQEKRLQISWFGKAEKRVVLKKTTYLKESVQFFLTDFKKQRKTPSEK
jgi:tetratricopeptide (TPR) repeat protein